MSQQIFSSVVDTVGDTPLVRLNRITGSLAAEICLKCEFRNPLFSVKDRIGKAMIEQAEASGQLKPGGLIIEPTSGNTGIALAFIARAKGYRCILVMPETMSMERRALLSLLGAEIVLTPGPRGMSGAIAKAEQLLVQYGDEAYGPRQFSNPANPEAHRKTTAEEIWQATNGELAVFVSGVGTGGTITGVGEVLKARNPAIKVIAVEPAASPVISGGSPSPHKIQGIGAGFIPDNLNVKLLDEVIQVSNEDAIETARLLSSEEGIPAGISTGANVWAAIQLAKRPEFAGKRIVTVGCSAVERYLSSALADQVRAQVAELSVEPI